MFEELQSNSSGLFRRPIKKQITLELESNVELKENEIEKRIKEINPLEITPMDALNKIYELKKYIEDNK